MHFSSAFPLDKLDEGEEDFQNNTLDAVMLKMVIDRPKDSPESCRGLQESGEHSD